MLGITGERYYNAGKERKVNDNTHYQVEQRLCHGELAPFIFYGSISGGNDNAKKLYIAEECKCNTKFNSTFLPAECQKEP